LDCVAYVHAAGLCHRDLKPENFCIERCAHGTPVESFKVVLIDFGFAKDLPEPSEEASSQHENFCGCAGLD
jgi:serine/threonine protein kinase